MRMSGHIKDLTGMKLGCWTVIKFLGTKQFVHGKMSLWSCRCDCGAIKEVTSSALNRKNKPRSCGCIVAIKSRNLFESRYEKTEGCWEWTGTLNRNGYGRIGYETAHRQAYKYAFGEIPKGIQVCHKCDNRKCVRPDHLFLGSIADNMRDKNEKNRQAKGTSIGNSILTEQKVLEIRQMRIDGNDYQTIADHFQIDWDLTRKICKNVQWKHVGLGEISKNIKQVRRVAKGEGSRSAKIKEEDVREIKKLLAEGIKGKEVAKKYGISPSTLCDIKTGRTWAHLEKNEAKLIAQELTENSHKEKGNAI